MRARVWISVTLIALLASSAPVVACAQEGSADGDAASRAAASEHFGRGIDLFNEGRFEAALAELSRAYELSPAPEVLYNIGRVEVELGHPVQAARAFERYLAEGGDRIAAPRRREVDTEITRMRARVGTLMVESNVAGSTVSIDGVDVASTPLEAPLELGAGEHTVGVRAPGHESTTRALRIAGGDRETIAVELRREVEERGTIRVSAELPDFMVLVDGVEVGRTPLSATVPVPAGDHVVVAERAGYRRVEQRVSVADRAEVEVRVAAELDAGASPLARATLRLVMPDVVWGLRIDGEERSTRRAEIELPVGVHVIEIEALDRRPYREELTLAPGEERALRPLLAWTAEVRRSRLDAASSQRTAGVALAIAGGVLVAGGLPLAVWNELEIASTDARIRALEGDRPGVCGMGGLGTPECTALQSEAQMLTDRQGTQDILRAVSLASAITGGIAAALGIVLVVTAPSDAEVDGRASARLRLTPTTLQLAF